MHLEVEVAVQEDMAYMEQAEMVAVAVPPLAIQELMEQGEGVMFVTEAEEQAYTVKVHMVIQDHQVTEAQAAVMALVETVAFMVQEALAQALTIIPQEQPQVVPFGLSGLEILVHILQLV
jgi:hypothetical protein